MPWIDSLNVEQYVGKVVDQKPPRFFSYPPLKIVSTPLLSGIFARIRFGMTRFLGRH